MGLWRTLYWILGIYDSYPSDKPSEKQIQHKKRVLEQLKEMKHKAELFENKVKFSSVVIHIKKSKKKPPPTTPPSSPTNSPIQVKRFLNVSMILKDLADEKKLSYL
jgi:hypothetical protein